MVILRVGVAFTCLGYETARGQGADSRSTQNLIIYGNIRVSLLQATDYRNPLPLARVSQIMVFTTSRLETRANPSIIFQNQENLL